MFVFDILLHWACVSIWVLFIRFIIEGLYEFSMRTFSLYEPLSLCSWRDESFSWESWVLWDLLFLGSKLSNLSLRSSYQCFLYYSIMGDRIYLYCIDMRCSSFLLTFSLLSFDFSPFLSYYSFFFSSHPNTYTPSWFDTFLHDPLMALLLLFLSHFTINILIYSS